MAPRPHYMGFPFIIGHGLSNIGNSCYMNSIIQALASNPVFRYELAALVQDEETAKAKKPVSWALHQLFGEIKVKGQPSTTVSPEKLKLALAQSNQLVR